MPSKLTRAAVICLFAPALFAGAAVGANTANQVVEWKRASINFRRTPEVAGESPVGTSAFGLPAKIYGEKSGFYNLRDTKGGDWWVSKYDVKTDSQVTVPSNERAQRACVRTGAMGAASGC